MNLTTATAPVKEVESRIERKVLKPARYKDANKQVVLPPEIEEKSVDVAVWCVYTSYADKTERHVFASKESADNYYKGF